MTIWPLQNVVLYRTPYQRVFISSRASAGYCVWLVGTLAIVLLPIFFAYASGGLWKREAFYREQPLVQFQHEMSVSVSGDKTHTFWSTDPKLNDLNSQSLRVPAVRYQELDHDSDGTPDELVIKVSMPMSEPARRFLFLGTFLYQLKGTVKMSMKGLIAVDESSGVGGYGVSLHGSVALRQNNPLRSVPEPRSIYYESPLEFDWASNVAYSRLAPFTFSGLVETYSRRNETIRFQPDMGALWSLHPSGSAELKLHMQIPNHVVYYVPSALEELKQAWVHIASFLFPVYILVTSFLGFIFTNQIVQTYCCSQLPYTNSKAG